MQMWIKLLMRVSVQCCSRIDAQSEYSNDSEGADGKRQHVVPLRKVVSVHFGDK